MIPEIRFKPPNGQKWPKSCTDDEFLQEMIQKAPMNWRRGICNKYSAIYLDKGRFEANTWLREGIKKYT